MASERDHWWFLLSFSALPLACTDDVPITPDGSTGGTTGSTIEPPGTTEVPGITEGSTSLPTTSLDGTSSSGAGSTTDPDDASSGTTMPIEPGSSSEGGSTGEPMGLCELWATEVVDCYGGYSVPELTAYCYDDLNMGVPVECQVEAVATYQCDAYGGGPCVANCEVEEEALDQCEDDVEAMMLGCDMIPMVPGTGMIETQCEALSAQANACDAAGYYISGFSQYAGDLPNMVEFCTGGAYFVFFFVPPAVGDTCGGAYEELLTCLSGLGCADLQNGVFPFGANPCLPQVDAVTCRCELGA